MKNTQENRDKIIEGRSIVQITSDDDRGYRGCMLVVTKKETWGVTGWIGIVGMGSRSAHYGIPWDKFELTGGVAMFGPDGGALGAVLEPLRHHP